MNSRFARNNTDHGESPRRRLRLFAINDRPRKVSSSPVTAKCDVQPPKNTKMDGPYNDSLASRKGPLKPSKEEPFLPRTRDALPAPSFVERTGTSPRPSPPRSVLSQTNPGTMTPPERTITSIVSSYETTDRPTRPGVTFQRNTTNIIETDGIGGHNVDPITAKMSTYGRSNPNHRARDTEPSASVRMMMTMTTMMMDPIAAKIAAAANDNDDNNNRSTSTRSSKVDAVAPPLPHHHHHHDQQQYMEIAPGQKVRLRGAKETWQCVEDDAYLPTMCFSCDADLCCIMDASYVLCPLCKVVSPVEGWAGGLDGGVGLGFTYQDLANWQLEIINCRQHQQTMY